MTFSLNTTPSKDGYRVEFRNGVLAGYINYIPRKNNEPSPLWEVDSQYCDRARFVSREAAEFYLLAYACEYDAILAM